MKELVVDMALTREEHASFAPTAGQAPVLMNTSHGSGPEITLFVHEEMRWTGTTDQRSTVTVRYVTGITRLVSNPIRLPQVMASHLKINDHLGACTGSAIKLYAGHKQ